MGFFDQMKSAVSDSADKLISVAPAISGGTGGGAQPERIQHALADLALPDSIVEWLTPPLRSLNFELTTESIPAEFDAPGQLYSVIKNSTGQQRVVLHMPSGVLENSSAWSEVSSLPATLTTRGQQPAQPLLVLSEGVNATHVAYSIKVKPIWENQHGFKMCFVPWRHIEELKGKQEAELQKYLPILLEITDMRAAAAAARSISEITPADVAALANVFVNIPHFTDTGATGWRLFFEESGMGVLVGQIGVEGNVGVVARNVLDRLMWQKPFPSYPKHDAMAILVVAISKRTDVNDVDRKRVEHIMKTYNIIPPTE